MTGVISIRSQANSAGVWRVLISGFEPLTHDVPLSFTVSFSSARPHKQRQQIMMKSWPALVLSWECSPWLMQESEQISTQRARKVDL